MSSKTKKVKAAGKFRTGFGTRVRKQFNKIEATQRIRQQSPFYKKAKAKRLSAGIWKCMKTGKVFAGPAYSLQQS